MYAGLIGLIIGYAMLMLAPGNIVRLLAEQKGMSWITANVLTKHFSMFTMIFVFQIFLWFFSIRAILTLSHMDLLQEEMKKEVLLAKVLCVVAFGMTAIMFCSPKFPPRSSFPGTVQLIIAAGILLRLQTEYKITLIKNNAGTFLFCVSCVYFLLTASVTIHDFYKMNQQVQEIIISAQRARYETGNEVLEVNKIEKSSNTKDLLSGFHTVVYELTADENDWVNISFARYYYIKGIRMIDAR